MSRKQKFTVTFLFVITLFIVYIFQSLCIINTEKMACSHENGPFSIFTGAFLHGNFSHLISNCKSLVITIPILLELYYKKTLNIIIFGIFVPPLAFYTFVGTPMIGISGLCFAINWYILFSGLISKSSAKFITSIAIGFFYSYSMLIGLTPEAGFRVAWEAHLAGFIVAILLTISDNLPKKPTKSFFNKG